jgi:putative flippase GtrA
MITFTKAQIASFIATGVDFVVAFLLLKYAGAPIVAAGATGSICGGVTHFLVSRTWVFHAQEKKWAAQLNRYVLVWIGNLVLNVSGIYLLTHFTGLKDMYPKIAIAIVVGVFYNYVLQKRFVFK